MSQNKPIKCLSALTGVKSPQSNVHVEIGTYFGASTWWRYRYTASVGQTMCNYDYPSRRLYCRWTENNFRNLHSTLLQNIIQMCCPRRRNWPMRFYSPSQKSTNYQVSWTGKGSGRSSRHPVILKFVFFLKVKKLPSMHSLKIYEWNLALGHSNVIVCLKALHRLKI